MRWWSSIATAPSRPRAPPIAPSPRQVEQEECRTGPLHGVPITIKEAFDVAGLATTSSHPPLKAQRRPRGCEPGRPAARGRRGDPGQDQCARAVRGLSDRQPAVRHHEERLGCTAHGRRVDRRRRGRGRGAPVAAGAWQRHRRLGAQSGALQRHLRAEAHRMARARPRPRARHARARRGPRATWACSARWRARSRISRRRCASSPVPTATRPRPPPVPLGTFTVPEGQGPAHRRGREQSAGQGIGRYGVRRAGDGPAARQGRRKGEARRARGARLAPGLGRLVRSFPVPGPRPAAAQRARAHPSRPANRPIRRRARRRARHGSTWRSSSPCSIDATASCASARSFLDDYDAWLMPVMPDAAFIRQKQSEPLLIDGVGASVFFRRHVVQLSRQPDRPAVDRAALRLLARGPADRPAAHRQALGRGQAPGRGQGSGEAAAALSGAARLQGLSRHSTLTLAFSMIGFHLANSARW